MSAVAAERQGRFAHEALFYDSASSFMEGTARFIREGLAAREPSFVLLDAIKIERLRATLGADAAGIVFADIGDVGRNPARIIPAWSAFVNARPADGRPIRGIGEPIWVERQSDELAESQLHEALLNVAFADAPAFRLLCPYDKVSLPPSVVAAARRDHPLLAASDATRKNADYGGAAVVTARFEEPLPAPLPSAPPFSFDIASLRQVRAIVHVKAVEAGLPAMRVEDLELAVQEIATNSVRHAGGAGTFRSWLEPSSIVCEIADPGRIVDPLVGRLPPPVDADGGRGLWVAHHLCDLVQVRSSARGTTVRLRMRLP